MWSRRPPSEEDEQKLREIAPRAWAVNRLFHGVDEFASEAFQNVDSCFEEARRLDPDNSYIRASCEALKSWSVDVNTPGYLTHHACFLEYLVALAPDATFAAHLWRESDVSPSVEQERYILRGLGYEGNHLESLVLVEAGVHVGSGGHKVPGSFDKAMADKGIARDKAQMEHCLETHKKHENIFVHPPIRQRHVGPVDDDVLMDVEIGIFAVDVRDLIEHDVDD